MASAAILKNRKIAISRPRFDRFRPNLARWRSSALLSHPTVKFFKKFKIHDGGDHHLEKSKYRYISAMVGPFATKFGTLMQFDPLDHSFCKNGPSSCTFWQIAIFNPIQNRYPLTDRQKNLSQVITSAWCLVFIFKNICCTQWQYSLLKSGNKTANVYVKNCSLYTLLMPRDQKPQKSKRHC